MLAESLAGPQLGRGGWLLSRGRVFQCFRPKRACFWEERALCAGEGAARWVWDLEWVVVQRVVLSPGHLVTVPRGCVSTW